MYYRIYQLHKLCEFNRVCNILFISQVIYVEIRMIYYFYFTNNQLNLKQLKPHTK